MTLNELMTRFINPEDKSARRIMVAKDGGQAAHSPRINETLTAAEFLNLNSAPGATRCAAIILSGVFGEESLELCNAILDKAASLMADQAVIAVDIQPIDRLNAKSVKALIDDPESLTNNVSISRGALLSAFSKNFELLNFTESFERGAADNYVFRFHKGAASSAGRANDAQTPSKTKRSVFDLFKKRGSAQEDKITPTALRGALSKAYIPLNPDIILLSPPAGLIPTLKTYLDPKSIIVYGLSRDRKKKSSQDLSDVIFKGEWADMADEPNGSAEFIFVGDMSEGINSTQYLKTLEDVARIRNRGGCVFIKQDPTSPLENGKPSPALSKTWPLNIMSWAKTRNSSVKSRPLLIGQDSYICVSEASPYEPLIRQDVAAGDSVKAIQKFKNYTTRDFFSVGEAARIVRLFPNIGDYCKALVIYAAHFGVTAAMRFNLVDKKHAEIPMANIVSALEKLIPENEKNEAVIFDLIGELYRLSCDYDMARKFWVKSLFQTQKTAGANEEAEIIIRKIRLYLPCEIDCQTSRVRIADPLLKNAVPKNTVILAESRVDKASIDSLADRFDGALIYTPHLKGNTEGDAERDSGSAPKTIFKPLIGLIAENSDLNKDSHEYAAGVSQQIITALIESFQGHKIGTWLETHQGSLTLSVEDFLARHLLILEAYAQAANENPEADILLAGGELGYFDTSLNLLLSRLTHEKIWLHSDQPKSNLDVYRPLFESKARAPAKPSIGSKNTSLNAWFNGVSTAYADNIDDYLSVQNVDINNSCLVSGNLANRYFGDSVFTLAGALYEAGEHPIIIDSSTTRTALTDMSSLWQDCYLAEETAENIPVLGMLRPKIEDDALIEGLEGLRAHIQTLVESLPLNYHGAPASFAFSGLAARVLSRDIPILLFNSLFIEKLTQRGSAIRLAAMSTREPHDHIVAESLQRKGVPITLVQCTDLLRHPRYKTPIADHVTAIDQAALEIFTDYLDVPKSAITVTGSPRSQINFHPKRVKAITELLDSRGLAVNPPMRVLFATRPGHLDVILKALERVAKQAAKHPGVQLIVKTHPREKPIRLAAYAKVLEENNVGGMANILNQGMAETLILISDSVISFPSAVVRVAVELGKKTLVYSPDDESDLSAVDTGGVKPLKAQTLEQLTQQLEPLFSIPDKTGTAKAHKTEDRETLTRICEVLKKQSRSKPFKHPKAGQKNTDAEIYSSLSLKETSRLIKQQASKKYADIGLFTRALSLARAPEDYVLILRDMALYAPPTIEAAQIFSELAKAAAEIDAFNEAIGHLASEKLAGYAAQLQYTETAPTPHAVLALAQSCASIGKIQQAVSWYDFGLTQNTNAALRARLENERGALSLHKWENGQESLESISLEKPRIIVVAERGTDPNIYISALPDDAEIDVYFDGKAGATLGDIKGGSKKIRSISSRDVLDDRAPELEGIIHRANALSALITDRALKSLKSSGHIEWLGDIRPAIEMELRAGLITQLRRHAALPKAVKGPYDAAIFACNTPAFLAHFADSLADIDIPAFVIGGSQSPARRRAFGAARKQGLGLTREKQEALLKTFKSAKSAKDVSEFDARLNKMLPRISKQFDEKSVIAVTSWRITTIKDGCLSLLENFPPDVPITIFDSSRHIANAKQFLSDINNFARENPQDIRPFSAQYHNIPHPDLKALKNSNLAKSIFASIRASKEGKKLPHAIQLGIWNQIGTLLYKTLPMLYDLHIQISAAAQQSGKTSLMVMPGRDAESLTAQNAAQKFGIKTTDVQTAYFSRGHTYTAPSGDIVTAMDEWSKDLFAQWFKIPEDKIHVLGTSRFDRFSKLRIAHEAREGQRKEGKTRPHICVATQPIQSTLTKDMLTCLNDLYISGTDFDCTVKLHPRQSETIIPEIESLAQDLHGAGRLTITKDGDLAQILLASNMVITAFSNVAIEAALMDRPVLIANFTGEDIPVPFMEFGIAEEARTGEAFQALAKRMLSDEAFQSRLNEKRHSYFGRYPSQWKGEAGKETAALILDTLQKPIIP
ncbi:MAG: CDP-glycerol glycerophosphotransferase family protein [Hellea sp.]